MKKLEINFKGETPKWIKWIYRGLMIGSGIWTLVSSTYTNIPQDIQVQILKALTLGNGVVYLIGNSFGYAESIENKEV